MAATITHAYTATGTPAGNGEVAVTQWNAAHTLTGTIDVANGGTGSTTARAAAQALGVPYVFAQSGTSASVGAVTTETALATITIPGGAVGPNGWVQVIATMSINSNANNKTFNLRAGGVSGALYYNGTFTTQLFGTIFKHIVNANSQTSQKGTSPGGGNMGIPGTGSFSIFTSAVDTTASWDIVITGTKANATDTFTLEAYQVIVCYGA